MTLLQKALLWFGPESEAMIRNGVVTEGRIVEYFLRRHPWEKECNE